MCLQWHGGVNPELAADTLKLTQEDARALLEEAIENRKDKASGLLGLLLLTQRALFPASKR